MRRLPGGARVDAEGIVKVMALKLRAGSLLAAEGERAAAALCGLVGRGFDARG